MTQPLAILNVEELHWLGDLGLPDQRRWLNHRTLGDEHRRTFPSAATDSNTRPQSRETTHIFGGVLICSPRTSAVLCVSPVNMLSGFFTAETQRSPRCAENAGKLRHYHIFNTDFVLINRERACRRRLVRAQEWSELSINGRAFRRIRRCERRVENRLARAYS
jgi:hypothetical protein